MAYCNNSENVKLSCHSVFCESEPASCFIMRNRSVNYHAVVFWTASYVIYHSTNKSAAIQAELRQLKDLRLADDLKLLSLSDAAI